LMGFISGACGGQAVSLISVCCVSHSSATWELWGGEVVYLELDYFIRITHSCSWHCYVLLDVLILKVVQVLFYVLEYSSPFMGDPAPMMNWHATTSCRGWHILRVAALYPCPVNWNQPNICRAKFRFIREYDSAPLVIHSAVCKC
jgi:hypothetical protein